MKTNVLLTATVFAGSLLSAHAGTKDEVNNAIKKLTEKYRNEERDREEAVRMAQQLLTENTQLKSRMQNLDKGYSWQEVRFAMVVNMIIMK